MLLKNFWTTLKRYKVASALNIIGLSIAFAAFAVIMMQVRYDLSFDKFHSKHDRIFRTEARTTDPGLYGDNMSRPLVRHIGETYPEVEAITLFGEHSVGMIAPAGTDRYIYSDRIMNTTPEVLDIFDFDIVEGHPSAFQRPGQLLLPESMARKLFPDGAAAGQLLKPQGAADSVFYEVAAVYRDFPKNSSLQNYIYTVFGNENYNDASRWSYQSYVLLRDPARQEALQEDISRYIGENSDRTGPQWEGVTELFRLTPIYETHFVRDVKGDDVPKANKGTVYTLILIAVLILVIAAINFVNFSMSLVPARIRGINTRKVLGESLASLRSGQIFEAAAICFLAVILSFFLIQSTSGTGINALLTADISIGRNLPILAGTLLIALVTGLIAGIFPAFYQTSFPPALVLKGSFGLTPRGKKMRTLLISFQYVVSFILIMVAIFIRVQNDYIRNFPIGLEKENVLVGMVFPRGVRERESAFIEEVKRNPAVKEVAFNSNSLIVADGGMTWGFSHKGEAMSLRVIPVSEDFIQTLGIQLAEGRDFRESDAEQNGAFILNETAKRQYGLELDEVLYEGAPELIGFAKDFHFQPLHYSVEPVALHYVKGYRGVSYAYFRVDAPHLSATVDFLNRKIKEFDPVYGEMADIKPLDNWLGDLYEQEWRTADLITLFSVVAILISVIGVFGLVLFETQYRRKEIGIRKINGATVLEILGLLNRNFVRIVIVCFVISVPVAWYAMTKWLEGFAYKSAIHVWIFIAALFVVSLITVLTVTLQSYRAATANPVNAVKAE